ncbi:IclR family transcriptional regulator [Agromyces aurantiacus]|uniref:IclR family transcriptional regulator n=1 Tax=Agromyces aurantiacus TaxID=165814 RepID=A0ABV9R6M0_9MICO|nr:helix-turn-helix domain-containing protein [Agromyces aurantiacus]MBM7503617.1 DNA-binding IclR family transcriptional regulator [Agromyces aurantiacus]
MAETPEYAAPAVDKALDILELLADRPGGMTQLDIARAIGLSSGQVFRPLMRLERRGYLRRDRQTGLYELSMRLFDLAHRAEPLRSLVSASAIPMRELATSTRQSCNLSVLDSGRVRVIAQVESPADFGFRVRVGALFDVEGTPTGRVLAAFGPRPADRGDDVSADARAIRAAGHLVQPDAAQPGITDVVFPVLRADRAEAVAALTVPYVATSYSGTDLDAVLAETAAAAEAIRAGLGV